MNVRGSGGTEEVGVGRKRDGNEINTLLICESLKNTNLN